jgi:uncharacterized membrane protein YtjA (UPF0391 family)
VSRLALSTLALSLLVAGSALAAPPAAPDRRIMGDDARVLPGERVHNLEVFGGDVEVLGEVTGNLSAFGGDVELRGPVHGDVAVLGGDLELRSDVSGNIQLAGGDALIAGTVHGDVITQGGEVTIQPPGVVKGAVRKSNDGKAALSVLRNVSPWLANLELEHAPALIFGGFRLVLWLGACLLGLLVLWFDGLRFTTFVDALAAQPARALGWGGLSAAACGAASVLLMVTILGIPLAMLLSIAFGSALYVGLAIAAAAAGSMLRLRWLAGRPGLQLCAGGLLLAVASLVPWLGSLVMLLAALAGVGAVIVSYRKPSGNRHTGGTVPVGAFL